MAVIDPSKPNTVKVFDIMSGKVTDSQIEHSTEIIQMDLNQVAMSSERKIAFVDSNKDLLISQIIRTKEPPIKISNMVDSF